MNELEKLFERRWPNFKPEEILSPDMIELWEKKGVFPYSFCALDGLQFLRRDLGKPIIVNHSADCRRGARSIPEAVSLINEAKAQRYSFHLWCAFDISVVGMTSVQLYEAIVKSAFFFGIGVYDTFIHIDDRDVVDNKIVVWDSRTDQSVPLKTPDEIWSNT